MSDLIRGLGNSPQNIPEPVVGPSGFAPAAEPKNEEAICAAVLRFINDRRQETFEVASRPDQEDRLRQSVEMVIVSPSGARAVVEHTRIESYPEQIADGKVFAFLLEPLEHALPSFLPEGKYNLTIECGVARKVTPVDEGACRLQCGRSRSRQLWRKGVA